MEADTRNPTEEDTADEGIDVADEDEGEADIETSRESHEHALTFKLMGEVGKNNCLYGPPLDIPNTVSARLIGFVKTDEVKLQLFIASGSRSRVIDLGKLKFALQRFDQNHPYLTRTGAGLKITPHFDEEHRLVRVILTFPGEAVTLLPEMVNNIIKSACIMQYQLLTLQDFSTAIGEQRRHFANRPRPYNPDNSRSSVEPATNS